MLQNSLDLVRDSVTRALYEVRQSGEATACSLRLIRADLARDINSPQSLVDLVECGVKAAQLNSHINERAVLRVEHFLTDHELVLEKLMAVDDDKER